MILPAAISPQLHDVNLIFIQIKEMLVYGRIYETNIFQYLKDFFVTQLVHVPSLVPLHYHNHMYLKYIKNYI